MERCQITAKLHLNNSSAAVNFSPVDVPTTLKTLGVNSSEEKCKENLKKMRSK